jgi:pyroglutamyl-peptidase
VTTLAPIVLVTGFEPFGDHALNPSGEIAKWIDGRHVGELAVRGAVLPVHHAEAAPAVATLLEETDPVVVLHLGLAEGRARLALERVAVNVMDYRLPDNAGYRAHDEPCVPGGPAAYWASLPLRAILTALAAEGLPAYLSNTAGTYLCNQTLYTTLHEIARRGLRARAGFLHLPLLPEMVARGDADQPSMDLGLMLRAVETILRVIADDGARPR